MNDTSPIPTSRREFLKHATRFASASALTGVALPPVHAAGSDLIQVALIGCGGRGTGAAANALSTKGGPIKLVAMADIFAERLKNSVAELKNNFAGQLDVPPDRQFVGLGGYQEAMNCLKPGHVAIFATPPAFRWVHFQYALQKNLNVFMEKPVTVDGPTSRKMFQLGEAADRKNLKVGVGLMVRHCRGRQELKKRLDDGEIGDLITMRAYRMSGPAARTARKPEGMSEVLYQVQRFHSFLWASGGVFSDFYIHQIDECSWMKGAWPTKAQAVGARHYQGDAVDQNLDVHQVEISYEDILNGDHEFAPGLDQLTAESPAPLQAGADGKYPVPQPGITKAREF